jgi:hypothetical protein
MLTNDLALAPIKNPTLKVAILSDVMDRQPRATGHEFITIPSSVTFYYSDPAFHQK